MSDYEALLLALEQLEKARQKLGLSPCADARVRTLYDDNEVPIGYAWSINEGGQLCGGVVLLSEKHPREDGKIISKTR